MMEGRRSNNSRRRRPSSLALAAALVLLPLILVGPASAARPLEQDEAGGGGDYSDDFAAAAPAEGAEGLGAAAGGSSSSASAALLAARASRDGGMRASEVGFAGVRFDGGGGGGAGAFSELASPLARACAAERAAHCAGVRTHKHDGRLFRCLAARAGGEGAFGDRCRVALAARVASRQANWRLDPRLVRECGEDALKLCPREDAQEARDEARDAAAEAEAAAGGGDGGGGGGANTGDGSGVLLCLARHALSSGLPAAGLLSPRCEAELSRASHAFLFLWAPSGPLTRPCDRDVGRLCLVADELLAQTPGAVDACLDGVLRRRWQGQEGHEEAGAAPSSSSSSSSGLGRRDDRRLAPACASLVRLSAAGRERALRREFSASLALYAAVHSGLGALERGTGRELARRDAGGEVIVGLTPEGVGAVVGGSVGGAVVLALAVGAACWGCAVARRRRRQRGGLMAGAGIGPPKIVGGGGLGGGLGGGGASAAAPAQQRVAAVFLQMAPKV